MVHGEYDVLGLGSLSLMVNSFFAPSVPSVTERETYSKSVGHFLHDDQFLSNLIELKFNFT
jgi:hypothetical protein